MFCDFVGITLLASVASPMSAGEPSAWESNDGDLLVALGKLAGRVTPVEETEPPSVDTASTSVRDSESVKLGDCVADGETTGTVTCSELESPLSVPMEMCCAVEASETVVTPSVRTFAAAVAAAMAKTNNWAERMVVDLSGTGSRNLAGDVQDYCGEYDFVVDSSLRRDSARLKAKKKRSDDYNAEGAIHRLPRGRSDCWS